PQLEHFLGKRSYAKALMFLGGETDIPIGACGGRPGPAAGNRGDRMPEIGKGTTKLP
ncbi:MAG: hypothetical protein JWM35_2529, partial [Verrucomicrobia bacterium]|nr:hypothetical protein [Verrucomicrobiota bacterium]